MDDTLNLCSYKLDIHVKYMYVVHLLFDIELFDNISAEIHEW